jgi:hypothetical protein
MRGCAPRTILIPAKAGTHRADTSGVFAQHLKRLRDAGGSCNGPRLPSDTAIPGLILFVATARTNGQFSLNVTYRTLLEGLMGTS